MSNANDSNDNDGEDAEKMRLDFEAFMLGSKSKSASEDTNNAQPAPATASHKSKKKKKKKKKSSLGGGGGTTTAATPPKEQSIYSKDGGDGDHISPTTTWPTMRSFEQPSISKSDKKRYYQLARLFNDKVQHTWFHLDDQLLSVLKNTASIRGRLPLEWKLLQSSTLKEPLEEEEEDGEEWKCHGLSGKAGETSYSFHLRPADVELALSSDAMQHEKMLSGARSLMSDLAECHEALGRALDNLWRFHFECTGGEGDGGEGDLSDMVELVSEAFRMLSAELYRKQRLVTLLFESTDDGILGVDPGDGSAIDGGLRVARECCKSWPRSCDESCVDEGLVEQMMKLGETSRQNVD